MFDFRTRWSTRFFAGTAASGALSYLHGMCGAILEELEHRGFASWLGGASTGFFMISVMFGVAGIIMFSAEEQVSRITVPAERSEPSPPRLADQNTVPLELALETEERLRI